MGKGTGKGGAIVASRLRRPFPDRAPAHLPRHSAPTRPGPRHARRRSPAAGDRTLSHVWRLVGVLTLAALGAGCASGPPRLTYAALPSAALGRPMPYAVYTPPGWTRAERLPLVVFLHGGGDAESCLDRAGLGQVFDGAIERGEMPRVVVVVPRGELGLWVNWYDGTHRYEDWVVDELLPLAAKALHTLECPAHCHVVGVSMGGFGALSMSLHRPDRLRGVGAISALVFDRERMIALSRRPLMRLLAPIERVFGPTGPADRGRMEREDLFLRWRSPADLGDRRLFLAWGDDDHHDIVESSAAFQRHLADHGVPHRHLVYAGGHGWRYWTPILPRVIRAVVGP